VSGKNKQKLIIMKGLITYEVAKDKTWETDSIFDNLKDAKIRIKELNTCGYFIRRIIRKGNKISSAIRLPNP
jgi:hypothetical protein